MPALPCVDHSSTTCGLRSLRMTKGWLRMWLAQQSDGFDSQLIYLLVFVAISVISTIFGRKAKRDEQAPARGRASRGDRQPTPPTSKPPRPVEHPSRPETTEPIILNGPIEPAAPRRPPVPFQAKIQPPKARPARQFQRKYAAPEEPAIEAHVELVPETAPKSRPESAVKTSVLRRAFDTAAVRQRLRTPADLRTAFILSEILAPPVALRDNQRSV